LIVDGVLVSGPVAARYGGLLERLVRAEARRNGEIVPDDLSRLLFGSSIPVDGGVRPGSSRSRRLPLSEVTEVVRTSVLSSWRR
jgi:hypothetical protein